MGQNDSPRAKQTTAGGLDPLGDAFNDARNAEEAAKLLASSIGTYRGLLDEKRKGSTQVSEGRISAVLSQLKARRATIAAAMDKVLKSGDLAIIYLSTRKADPAKDPTT
jgi:hypothetical protein